MRYAIAHKTTIRYSDTVREGVMEVRKKPRSDARQTCLEFTLETTPPTRVLGYVDGDGNEVLHFGMPRPHDAIVVDCRCQVDVDAHAGRTLPERLRADDWDVVDALVDREGLWSFVLPSRYTPASRLLDELAVELEVRRRHDPLTLLRELGHRVHRAFEFAPDVTHVHSPIDHAIRERKGVCQDLAHILVALARRIGLPCRYVSGYLAAAPSAAEGPTERSSSHAWVEAFLPGLGWVGYDPTNDAHVAERHIAIATGRDYGDVPPTRGVFKGAADSELDVEVSVTPLAAEAQLEPEGAATGGQVFPGPVAPIDDLR